MEETKAKTLDMLSVTLLQFQIYLTPGSIMSSLMIPQAKKYMYI